MTAPTTAAERAQALLARMPGNSLDTRDAYDLRHALAAVLAELSEAQEVRAADLLCITDMTTRCHKAEAERDQLTDRLNEMENANIRRASTAYVEKQEVEALRAELELWETGQRATTDHCDAMADGKAWQDECERRLRRAATWKRLAKRLFAFRSQWRRNAGRSDTRLPKKAALADTLPCFARPGGCSCWKGGV